MEFDCLRPSATELDNNGEILLMLLAWRRARIGRVFIFSASYPTPGRFRVSVDASEATKQFRSMAFER